MNLPSVLVLALLIVGVALAVRSIRKGSRTCSGCDGCCTSCISACAEKRKQ